MASNHSLARACVVISVLLATSAAIAQDAPTPKLYRWVGADGKPHYSDQIPPEALDKARQEISSKSGLTVGQVDRALTPEERAAAAAKAEQEAKIAKVTEDAKQSDQVLLASYPTERELTRAYTERGLLQNETVKATRIGMESQQQGLSSLLIAASNMELTGKSVNAKLTDSILTARRQLLDQQTLLVRHTAQGAALQTEYHSTLERWRKLRTDAEAARKTPDANPSGAPKS